MSAQAPAYLIRGVCPRKEVIIGINALSIEGDISASEHAAAQDKFACLIWRDDSSTKWTGQMVDSSGSSTLSDVEFDDTMLCFTQRNKVDGSDIDYEFILQDGVGNGYRWGNRTGSHDVSCTVTPCPEQMFQNSPQA